MPRYVAIAVLVLLAAPHAPVAAQDAAETAIILSGTGQGQGRAARSMGQSVARNMGNAANAVPVSPRRSQPRAHRAHGPRGSKAGKFAIALPADVDPLENTDAPTYALANGASIRVSGGLRGPLSKQSRTPTSASDCGPNCPE